MEEDTGESDDETDDFFDFKALPLTLILFLTVDEEETRSYLFMVALLVFFGLILIFWSCCGSRSKLGSGFRNTSMLAFQLLIQTSLGSSLHNSESKDESENQSDIPGIISINQIHFHEFKPNSNPDFILTFLVRQKDYYFYDFNGCLLRYLWVSVVRWVCHYLFGVLTIAEFFKPTKNLALSFLQEFIIDLITFLFQSKGLVFFLIFLTVCHLFRLVYPLYVLAVDNSVLQKFIKLFSEDLIRHPLLTLSFRVFHLYFQSFFSLTHHSPKSLRENQSRLFGVGKNKEWRESEMTLSLSGFSPLFSESCRTDSLAVSSLSLCLLTTKDRRLRGVLYHGLGQPRGHIYINYRERMLGFTVLDKTSNAWTLGVFVVGLQFLMCSTDLILSTNMGADIGMVTIFSISVHRRLVVLQTSTLLMQLGMVVLMVFALVFSTSMFVLLAFRLVTFICSSYCVLQEYMVLLRSLSTTTKNLMMLEIDDDGVWFLQYGVFLFGLKRTYGRSLVCMSVLPGHFFKWPVAIFLVSLATSQWIGFLIIWFSTSWIRSSREHMTSPLTRVTSRSL